MPETTGPAHEVPSHLSAPSKRWLAHLIDDYDWTPSEWRLATLAADSFDRAQTARRILNREGLTIVSPRGEQKSHPAVVIARDAAALYAKLVAQLGLDQDEDEEAVRSGPIQRDSIGRRKGKR